ncbi:unnamed protein product [Ilex paraguariensis]|uniref:Uncharacterized protein n=1 Tax=Ilex paraguariensis TaxID=185542 RepID=A0ABC8RQM3_9AQUA
MRDETRTKANGKNSTNKNPTINQKAMSFNFIEDIYRKLLVPNGGCYRQIDVRMSNCINSGITKDLFPYPNQLFLPQPSPCLHIQLWNGESFGDGFVEVR